LRCHYKNYGAKLKSCARARYKVFVVVGPAPSIKATTILFAFLSCFLFVSGNLLIGIFFEKKMIPNGIVEGFQPAIPLTRVNKRLQINICFCHFTLYINSLKPS